MMPDTQRQRSNSAVRQENSHGAYLIVCRRKNAAMRHINRFLLQLYCKKGGCGTCRVCRSVLTRHVDILRLSAPKVDDIRDAIAFIAQKSFTGSHRSIVIDDADDMTTAAANSLLKTLEAPPADTVIVLSARSISGVLPTIVSRCTVVHISPDANAPRTIADTLGVDAARAYILADLSGGFVEEARLMQDDAAFWPMRDAALDICKKLLSQKGMAISTHADYIEANKDSLFLILGMMQTFYRDVLVYQKTKNAALIINRDCADIIIQAASHFTSGAISNIIKVILEAERRFCVPVNFRLATEKLFFDILEEKNRWKKL